MKVLMIGNEANYPDFVKYANERMIHLTVVSEKDWETACSLNPSDYHEVLAFSDTAQIFVERIKKNWKINNRNEIVIDTLTNKKRLRENAAASHFFPKHVIFSATEHVNSSEQICKEKDLCFPVVVKPASGFYSAGVSRVNDIDGLARAISLARRINNQIHGTKGDVIIEEYLAGREIAVDGIIHNGKVFPLIYHSKYPKLEGPFFHEEAYISQTVKQNFSEMQPLQDFISTLELKSGPFHIEMRQCALGKWYLLECAPRFSGMGVSTNIPFFFLTGKHAYDFLLWPDLIDTYDWSHASGYVIEFDFAAPHNTTLSGIENVIAKIRELPDCIFFQYANNGDYVLAPPNNLNAVLTVFCRINTFEEAVSRYQILKTLENELSIEE